MVEVPKTLNWVKARTGCSIEHLYMQLQVVIEDDVQTANQEIKGAIKFLHKQTGEALLVVRNKDMGGVIDQTAVAFQLRDGNVVVSRRSARVGSEQMFVAKPHVAVNGECKFEVGSEVLEVWQVSKRALEALFFEL